MAKDQKQNNSQANTSDQAIGRQDVEVHAMPKKFVEATQKTGHLSRRSSLADGGNRVRKLSLIAISLILFIILVIGGIWFYLDRQNANSENTNNTAVVDQNVNTNTNDNENTNTNDNENVNTNTNDNENVNTNTNDNENTNTNDNENTNTNQNVNTNVNDNENTNTIYDYELAIDSDSDGLSDEEENIFGTDPSLEDTDGDGYKDGQEIVNLYNPLVSVQDIFSSGMVRRFIPPSQEYSFLRPSSWVAKISGDGSEDIVILPNSEVGTEVIIEIRGNEETRELGQALEETLGPITNYQNYSLAGVPAFRSIKGNSVFTIYNGSIFIITNREDPFGNLHFGAIFEMILNSWQWQENIDTSNL